VGFYIRTICHRLFNILKLCLWVSSNFVSTELPYFHIFPTAMYIDGSTPTISHAFAYRHRRRLNQPGFHLTLQWAITKSTRKCFLRAQNNLQPTPKDYQIAGFVIVSVFYRPWTWFIDPERSQRWGCTFSCHLTPICHA